MPNQRAGYYNTRKAKLLKDYDTTSALMRASLVARYGQEFANTIQREARWEFERLIPEIPYIKGLQGKLFSSFLLGTAQELAIYKAMKKSGKPPGEAWELCHETLRLKVAEIPRWKLWLLSNFMFIGPVKRILVRRARHQQKDRFGDFEIEYVIGEGDECDFGVNYLQCGNLTFLKKNGGEEFAPYVCMSDIALSEAMGWGLCRTQTLADGCPHCNFRFKKGGATKISSKTPEVQETIERISKKETEQVAPADG